MLTKLSVRNFKKLESSEIDLSSSVVFVGPNNSGKTSALQAIAFWELGMRRWAEKQKRSKAKERIAATINRKDILSVPVPSALQLWNDLNVRRAKEEKNGTANILIETVAEGFTKATNWKLGFEFDYANTESIYCRIIKDPSSGERQLFPSVAQLETIGYLPPMSGLAAEEDRLVRGSIQRLIGEGRTAQVVRNLCLLIADERPEKWDSLSEIISDYFAVKIDKPEFNDVNGQITMTYRESSGTKLDLSNSGRGFQQVLLLFAYIFANQSSILLLDEPDAHLEIIRQKEIFNILSETANRENTQIIIATHSEAILNEAAEKSKIIGFLGKPKLVNDKSQLIKSLVAIGFDQYYLAQQKKWVLYLEGTTDLALLKAFAHVLQHPVEHFLERPFLKSVSNIPSDARNHFYGLKEAVSELKGIAIFDNIDKQLQSNESLCEMMWNRREIENYLPIPEALLRYLENQRTDLFSQHDPFLMQNLINDYAPPVALKNKNDDWWKNTKISDDFLDKVLRTYFSRMKMPMLLTKSNYSDLAYFAKADELDAEIVEKLDSIMKIAEIEKASHVV
jgi:AAA15 family ATPase/GTPase